MPMPLLAIKVFNLMRGQWRIAMDICPKSRLHFEHVRLRAWNSKAPHTPNWPLQATYIPLYKHHAGLGVGYGYFRYHD
jgi:hypothetical protein